MNDPANHALFAVRYLLANYPAPTAMVAGHLLAAPISDPCTFEAMQELSEAIASLVMLSKQGIIEGDLEHVETFPYIVFVKLSAKSYTALQRHDDDYPDQTLASLIMSSLEQKKDQIMVPRLARKVRDSLALCGS